MKRHGEQLVRAYQQALVGRDGGLSARFTQAPTARSRASLAAVVAALGGPRVDPLLPDPAADIGACAQPGASKKGGQASS
jgi:hypothetical protein